MWQDNQTKSAEKIITRVHSYSLVPRHPDLFNTCNVEKLGTGPGNGAKCIIVLPKGCGTHSIRMQASHVVGVIIAIMYKCDCTWEKILIKRRPYFRGCFVQFSVTGTAGTFLTSNTGSTLLMKKIYIISYDKHRTLHLSCQ